MKKLLLPTSLLLFSTFLGFSFSPTVKENSSFQFSFSDKLIEANSDTDTKQNDIDTATDTVNSAVERVYADINSSNSSNNLKEIAENSLKKINTLSSIIKLYQNGGTSEDFTNSINQLVLQINDLALPDDWTNASALIQSIYSERSKEVQAVDANKEAAKKINIIMQKFPVKSAEDLANGNASKTQLESVFGPAGSGLAFKTLAYSLDGTSNTQVPGSSDLEFSQFILKSMADSRKVAINALSTPNNEQKAVAIQKIDSLYLSAQNKLEASTTTFKDLIPLLSDSYKQFDQVVPETYYSPADASSKNTAISSLQKAYDNVEQKLKDVSGFDGEVKTALTSAQDLLTQYTNKIKDAVTLTDVNTLKTEGTQKITATSILSATDEQKKAVIAEINTAVTAQITAINADSLATDSAKTAANTTAKNIASHYIQNAQAENTTVQVLKTIQTAAISSLKAIIPIHDLTSKKVTTSQLTAATNALIAAGNAKKLVIQNDASVSTSDKSTAYTAVDKLVTTYTNQLKQATTTTALSQVQSTGVTAITNFQATQSVTTTSPITQLITTKMTTIKPTNQKLVYAISSLKLYQSNQLKGKVVASYAKHRRTNRPVFKVLRTVKNDAGKKAYYVQNQVSGKKGYITTSAKSVAYAYYQTTPKRIKVISNGGLNLYKKSTLSGKQHHYQKGQSLKVHKLIKSGTMTRFQLMNGSYVTANKKLVISTAY
ncbi:DUF1542 domain-containing protein [Secundilactobacillus kimchicus]|uniref:DUF5776 domain-containing protein n=1 Tax=Secundilactobacillus kimchicus TaxID=528209 RepID=UPI001C02F781|nr:DUF5776 domain-containing protein [Secundilactobacillus kimchicus]MBT9672394.1 DUF1542 domain-containing protein [Secundilactobacillus kimchicus]